MTDESRNVRVRETETEIVVERTFDAPRALVWEAFSTPERLAVWWGPTGFTTTTESMDLRDGGEWVYTMHGPDGMDYPNRVRYEEVREPEMIRYVHVEEDVEDTCHAATIRIEAVDDDHTKVTTTLTFPDSGTKDEVVKKYGALEGARQHMASLAAHLAGQDGERDGVLVIRRVLDAPVGLVWDVWTDARHMMAWFHPEAWVLSISEMDLREGGSYFYCMSADGMPDMHGLWQIRTVREPERLEFVVSFSDAERGVVRAPFSETWPLEVLCEVTIERHAGVRGGTVLTLRSWPINASEEEVATFAGGIGSMQQGWGQTLESLEKYLGERVGAGG